MKRSLDLGDTRSQKCIVYSAPFLKSLHRSKDWQRLAQAATVERVVLLFSFRLLAHFPFAFTNLTRRCFARPRTPATDRFRRSAIVVAVRPSPANLRSRSSSAGVQR